MKVYFMLNLYIKHMINISIFLYIFGQIFKNLTSQKMMYIYLWLEEVLLCVCKLSYTQIRYKYLNYRYQLKPML